VQFHSFLGTDKYYTKKDSFSFNIALSPFYQHSSGARDENGLKVHEGDMYGKWNMLGLFFGHKYTGGGTANPDLTVRNASPADRPFTLANYNDGVAAPNTVYGVLPRHNDPLVAGGTDSTRTRYPMLSAAWRVLDGILGGTAAAANVVDHEAPVLADNPAEGIAAGNIDKNYTLESNFDPDDNNTGYLSVPMDTCEKYGMRGQICFEFSCGLGMKCKGGFVEYRLTGTFRTHSPLGDATSTDPLTKAQGLIDKYLMNPHEQVLNELGIYTHEQKKTVFEDTYIELFWNLPWEIEDASFNHVATVSPYLAVGVWIPSGKKKDQDQMFSVPSGADGFWGLSAVGSINLDFPGLIQLSFGGGATFYESRTISGYRVPSSQYQSVIYPWKARIKKRPGTVWYLNASLKTEEFIEQFSFFFDYVYSEHKRDSITLKETVTTRNAYFFPEKLREDSKWRTNVIHAGLNYRVSSGLDLGFSFQAHLSGARVYKTTTMMGTLNFNF